MLHFCPVFKPNLPLSSSLPPSLLLQPNQETGSIFLQFSSSTALQLEVIFEVLEEYDWTSFSVVCTRHHGYQDFLSVVEGLTDGSFIGWEKKSVVVLNVTDDPSGARTRRLLKENEAQVRRGGGRGEKMGGGKRGRKRCGGHSAAPPPRRRPARRLPSFVLPSSTLPLALRVSRSLPPFSSIPLFSPPRSPPPPPHPPRTHTHTHNLRQDIQSSAEKQKRERKAQVDLISQVRLRWKEKKVTRILDFYIIDL